MMITTSAVKLNLKFDPLSLQRDLRTVDAAEAKAAGYPGEGHRGWTSLLLCGPQTDGNTADRMGGGGKGVIDRLPYFQHVLASLDCPVHIARLMALEPGGEIAEHQDVFLGFAAQMVRLHVPVVTRDAVEFYLDGRRCEWREGELWYGDFTKRHSAVNRSPVRRVHLVMDVVPDERLLRHFPESWRNILPSVQASQSLASDEDYGFEFILPAGFALPGLQPLEQELPASVRRMAQQWMVWVNSQPLLKLQPIAAGQLEVLGLPIQVRLCCERSEGRVSAAYLELDDPGRTHVALAVAARH